MEIARLCKAAMQPDPSAPKPQRKWHLVRWTFAAFVALFGWFGWKAYDFRNAVKEANALGWLLSYRNPFALIQADWKNAFRKDTWGNSQRLLSISRNQPLEGHYSVIRRLEPWQLSIQATFSPGDLSELRGMSNLRDLVLFDCPNLTNLDSLNDAKELEILMIYRAPALANIEGLRKLKGLKRLRLSASKALMNIDAARELTTLEHLSLKSCAGIKNVDGVLALRQLISLDLSGCKSITEEVVNAAKDALPSTDIEPPN
jgi:hypothetical protein